MLLADNFAKNKIYSHFFHVRFFQDKNKLENEGSFFACHRRRLRGISQHDWRTIQEKKVFNQKIQTEQLVWNSSGCERYESLYQHWMWNRKKLRFDRIRRYLKALFKLYRKPILDRPASPEKYNFPQNIWNVCDLPVGLEYVSIRF